MNYDQIFDQAIDRLYSEERFRVSIDILRNKEAYPNARCFAGHNGAKADQDLVLVRLTGNGPAFECDRRRCHPEEAPRLTAITLQENRIN